MKITIKIPPFKAKFDESVVRHFLRDVGDKTKQIMVQQAAAPKTGREYKLPGGGTYTASSEKEFPANKFGHLSRSYRVEITELQMTMGTDISVYPRYLRTGTKRMKARKFLRQALEDAMEMEHFKKPFVKFVK